MDDNIYWWANPQLNGDVFCRQCNTRQSIGNERCYSCNLGRITSTDPINPSHYTKHPSGIECITVTEQMSFTLGNAIKYIWRADLKGGIEDLRKAAWYIDREIKKREQST